MLWTLDFDDYSGQFCERGQFPLAYAIKAVFDEYDVVEATTTTTTTTATTTTTTTTTTTKNGSSVTSSVALKTTVFDSMVDYPQFVLDEDYMGNQFDRDESTTAQSFYYGTRTEGVISASEATPQRTTLTTASSSMDAASKSSTILTFYLPKNLSDLKGIEIERLNSVMYEILNVPVVLDSDVDNVFNNLTNRSVEDKSANQMETQRVNGASFSALTTGHFLRIFFVLVLLY